ncbi:MAG TPA: YbaB/EbfC family nucleoid-associated protein [Actinoplanes sp.]|nr:YbaB/EbfC family nucleoid-associated protein [Actinoplanes sp.]
MIQDWQAGIEAQAAQARELSSRLAALAVTVRSGDEFVEVTVGSSGDVIRLELAEGIRGQCGTGRAQCGTGRAGSAADPRRTENCVCWFPCCSALCAIIGSRGLDRWVDGTSAAVGGLRECVNRRRPHLAVAA